MTQGLLQNSPKIIILSLIVVALSSCTQPNKAREVLLNDGYEDVEILGHAALGCSEDDFFSTRFRGTKNGREIKGVVCSGFWKGATIRPY